jgi:ribonuclease G
MATDIIINATSHETRIALLEEGRLVELWLERNAVQRMVGDIYKGRVEKVLPGLQAAFVDIGIGKSGFLSFSDTAYDPGDFDPEERAKVKPARRIEEVLKNGQDVMVQVSKEPISNKGPRLTSHISFAGRFCVLVPNEERIGVSRRVEDRAERRRLKEEFLKNLPGGYGLVIRTASEGEDEKSFKRDLKMLLKTWQQVKRDYRNAKTPSRIYSEPPMVVSFLRELAAMDIGSLITDDKRTHDLMAEYTKSIDPVLKKHLLLYREDIPLFEAYDIESQIEKALRRRVWLKNGGQIVIEQTEALVTIDVNSGRYTGKRDAEGTITRVNVEAAREIARQLRLRDIGGIIVIDFIDMDKEANRRKVLSELKEALKDDRSKPKVYEISPLGLVEMSRKRVRPSLWQAFSHSCPTCHGSGRVLSPETMAARLDRWFMQAGRNIKNRRLEVVAHPLFIDYLEGPGRGLAEGLRKRYRCDIRLKREGSGDISEFKINDLSNGHDITREFSVDRWVDLD